MSPELAQKRLAQQLALELGDTLSRALDDPSVFGIFLNPNGELWVSSEKGMDRLDATMSPDRAESLLATIASMAGLTINRAAPILETTLPPQGYRIAAVLPPVSDAPFFTIRKPANRVFPLDALVLDSVSRQLLLEAVLARRNVLISGMTGSGKTTLANSLLREICLRYPDQRVFVLEDTPELRLDWPNAIRIKTMDGASLFRLVRTTLRHDPTRIVIGEVRGSEAFALLKAWNTGHAGGIATVHANSASSALDRLDQLAQEANVPPQGRLVHEAIDIVVHLAPRCQIREVLPVKQAA